MLFLNATFGALSLSLVLRPYTSALPVASLMCGLLRVCDLVSRYSIFPVILVTNC